MTKAELFRKLPKDCCAEVSVRIDDFLARQGIPMDYVVHDMGRQLGHFIQNKLPLIMQREESRSFPYSGSTNYRAKIFVFTEQELTDLLENNVKVVKDESHRQQLETLRKELNKLGKRVGELHTMANPDTEL